jgi:hypothetical protein
VAASYAIPKLRFFGIGGGVNFLLLMSIMQNYITGSVFSWQPA